MVPKRARITSVSLTEAIQNDYARILGWARRITKNDLHAAEDLVQDLALRSLQAVEQSDISNLDSYVYRSLLNAHLSKARKHTLRRETPIDSELLNDTTRLSIDPRLSHSVREQLIEICHFATVRKESSIAASIVLLRYFHGYFTTEVVKLLKRPRNSIEVRLASARREIQAAVRKNTPSSADRTDKQTDNKDSYIYQADEFIEEIRREIFVQQTGRCLREDQWRRIYVKPNLQPSRDEIAHFVGCKTCLDSINTLLRIPLLRERHPLDTRGAESTFGFLDHIRAKAAADFDDEASIPNRRS